MRSALEDTIGEADFMDKFNFYYLRKGVKDIFRLCKSNQDRITLKLTSSKGKKNFSEYKLNIVNEFDEDLPHEVEDMLYLGDTCEFH